MAGYLMGIDNGSTVTKVGIFDFNGNEVAVSASKAEMIMPVPGYYERDMNQIWQANIRAISEALKKSGIKGEDIAAVSLTGHGNGLHLIDEKGLPVHNSIESPDTRAAGYVEKWYKDGTFEKILSKTMQCIWPAQTSTLLAWMQDNKPDVLNRARWALTVKDFVRFKLTGEVFAEITDISGAGVLNNRDVKFDAGLLEEYGVGELIRLMPDLRNSSDICGYVTKEASELTGLKEGTPVAGGLYDIDSAGIATGLVDESMINIIVGTWCNNQYVSKNPVVDKDLFSCTICPVPGYWLVLEGSPTSASNLEWFVSEFMQEESKIARQSGTSVYKVCDEAVEKTGPFDSNIVFVPFLYGSNAGMKAKAGFIGLEGWNNRSHVLRAIYEGIVFSHKTHIEKLLRYRKTPESARIAGGAARSNVWVQMFADILQIPMEITGVSELGTLGAAICAGVGCGVFGNFNEAVDSMVKIVRKVEPNVAQKAVYENKYMKYRKAITSLESYWEL